MPHATYLLTSEHRYMVDSLRWPRFDLKIIECSRVLVPGVEKRALTLKAVIVLPRGHIVKATIQANRLNTFYSQMFSCR